MAFELLLDDAPGPAPLALAVELGWATLPLPVRTVHRLTAVTAREHPEALMLLPVAEYAFLQDSHLVLPALAAGGRHGAATVLVSDRRLDEVEAPVVDLTAVSLTAELLARATLAKFYGIAGVTWRSESPVSERALSESPASERTDEGAPTERPLLEVREGGEALHLLDEPGDAVVAELGRAWFVLTGLPAVSHLLVVSRALLTAEAERVRGLTEALPPALAVVHQRRRELRRELSDRYGVSRDLLNEFYNDQFATLTGDAQRSAAALFARGAWGLGLPTVSRLNLAPGSPQV